MTAERTYMDPKEINTDVYAFNHIEEVGLKNKCFSWVVENAGSVLQLLEIFEASTDVF